MNGGAVANPPVKRPGLPVPRLYGATNQRLCGTAASKAPLRETDLVKTGWVARIEPLRARQRRVRTMDDSETGCLHPGGRGFPQV